MSLKFADIAGIPKVVADAVGFRVGPGKLSARKLFIRAIASSIEQRLWCEPPILYTSPTRGERRYLTTTGASLQVVLVLLWLVARTQI